MSGKVIKVLSNIRFIRLLQSVDPVRQIALPRNLPACETPQHPSEPYVQCVPSSPSKRRPRQLPSPADMADACSLAQWLQTAALPKNFALYPWAFVQDSGLFRTSLLADLSSVRPHARFRPALEEARRLRELFSPSSCPDLLQTGTETGGVK